MPGAIIRANHDGTKEKGYFICNVSDGKVTRRFVEYKPGAGNAAKPQPGQDSASETVHRASGAFKHR
jgi:major membrane immunogen (membrane-anchored lipoprotein)